MKTNKNKPGGTTIPDLKIYNMVMAQKQRRRSVV